jgi:Short C-terminal domain
VSRRSPPPILLLLPLLLPLGGCELTPLGEDFEELSADERDARVVQSLGELFEFEVDGAGTPRADRRVTAVDMEGITYETDEGTSHLTWADVESAERVTHEDLPARPETLHLYLGRESDSEASVRDLIVPLLATTGLTRTRLTLHMRPRWSLAKLRACLDHLRDRRQDSSDVAPIASTEPASEGPPTQEPPIQEPPTQEPPTQEPPTAGPGDQPPLEDGDLDGLDDVEAKLERLRIWHERGLITEEEYQAKRQELLEKL